MLFRPLHIAERAIRGLFLSFSCHDSQWSSQLASRGGSSDGSNNDAFQAVFSHLTSTCGGSSTDDFLFGCDHDTATALSHQLRLSNEDVAGEASILLPRTI